ncbi:MAG: hypothetical protein MUF54_16425 [Polyangiaceae bacterium]|jgi:Zn-dependent protease|nr:hypothetical protein [Polyangiaceae bacterium]
MSRFNISFRAFGIPVRIEPGFWLITILLGMHASVQAMLIVAVSALVAVLVHELGHALVSKSFGASPEVMLYTLGGVTRSTLPEGSHFTRPQSALVTFAGPMAGFLLGGLAIAFRAIAPMQAGSVADAISGLFVQFNIGWGLINLLPVLPLDGGNLLRVALSGSSAEEGLTRSLWVSVVVGPLLALGALLLDSRWAALLFAFLSFSAGRQLLELRRAQADRDLELDAQIDAAYDALHLRDLQTARQHATFVARCAKVKQRRAVALHVLAHIDLEQGAPEQAIKHLEEVDLGHMDPFLFGACLLALQRPGEAVPHLERAVENSHHPHALELLITALEASGNTQRAEQLRHKSSPAGPDAG